MKVHPSKSLGHLAGKPKMEANPKPNTFLCKLSCCLGLGSSSWKSEVVYTVL